MDWFDLYAVQGTLKSLLQHHSLKASFLHGSDFCMVPLSHVYMATGNTTVYIALHPIHSTSCLAVHTVRTVH